MWLGGVLMEMGWLAGALCQMTPAPSVELVDRNVHIQDVAILTCIDPDQRDAVGDRIIARLSENVQEIELSATAIAQLVRRRAPGLTDLAVDADPRTIRLHAPAAREPAARAEAPCFTTSRAIAQGRALDAASLIPAGCQATTAQTLRYDRSTGLVRAMTNIPAGAYLGRVAAPAARLAEAGDAVSIAVIVGPVRIERDVHVVQPGADGERTFVRDADGNVFAASILLNDRGAQR